MLEKLTKSITLKESNIRSANHPEQAPTAAIKNFGRQIKTSAKIQLPRHYFA